MGVHENVSYDKFPKQGQFLGLKVQVCFHYDTSRLIDGEIVRDDAEEPGEMIIKLSNGKYVRSVECQYKIAK